MTVGVNVPVDGKETEVVTPPEEDELDEEDEPPELVPGDVEPPPVVGVVGVETVFETVTVIDEVWVLFAKSRAVAMSVWVPFDKPPVFQVPEYGAVVSSVPRFEPSSLNCTPITPMLSLAVADKETEEPETVAPFEGEEMDIEGEVVSGVGVITPDAYSYAPMSHAEP